MHRLEELNEKQTIYPHGSGKLVGIIMAQTSNEARERLVKRYFLLEDIKHDQFYRSPAHDRRVHVCPRQP